MAPRHHRERWVTYSLQALGSEAHTERLVQKNCTEAVFFHAETGEHIFCYGFSGHAAAGLQSSYTKDCRRTATECRTPGILAGQQDAEEESLLIRPYL